MLAEAKFFFLINYIRCNSIIVEKNTKVRKKQC